MIGSRLELSDIEFNVECLPEYIPIKGNCSAIDDETDKATEDEIIRQLDSGNPWAWCRVHLVGTFKGLTADDYLGGCSYQSRADFMTEGGYYEDMKNVVLSELQSQLDDILDQIDENEYKNKIK